MIHYHGLPITPQTVGAAVLSGGHAFVSFNYARALGLVVEACQSFAIDNGAFTSWQAGNAVEDWSGYYEWAAHCMRIPACDFAVIPDVIDGSEEANDLLVRQWPLPAHFGAPVWHMHESLARLRFLAQTFPRICIGSSGDFRTVGTPKWWSRMGEAMRELCDEHGRPGTKIHGLRMLDPAVFSKLPFASADSTNVARNKSIEEKWRGPFAPPTQEARGLLIRQRIEAHNAPPTWDFHQVEQPELLL